MKSVRFRTLSVRKRYSFVVLLQSVLCETLCTQCLCAKILIFLNTEAHVCCAKCKQKTQSFTEIFEFIY